MAVAYVSSSTFGATDTSAASLSVPVPASTAADHVALLVIKQDGSGNPTVTWPAGFTEKINLANANLKLKVAWKRLTGADAGNYTMTWTGSQFTQGQCILLSGAIATGDPVEVSNTAVSSFTLPQPSVSITTATSVFLVHFGGTLNFRTSTQPTGYTRVQDANYLDLSYLIAGAVGTQTASGGSVSGTATDHNVALLGILPAAGGGGFTGTAAVTQGSDSSTAAGQLGYSGTATPTEAADTASASGKLGYTGASAVTQAAQTASATGKLGYSGTTAATQASQTGAASGSFTAGASFAGTVAVTQAGQTSSASGKLGYSGTVARTQANNTAAATGTVANPVTGTVSATQANQIASIVGQFAALVAFGTASAAVGQASAASVATGQASGASAATAGSATASTGAMTVPTATGG